MVNPIRDYDWGSTSELARLQGRAATGRPEAELWMGAHPSAPSHLSPPGSNPNGSGLDQLVTQCALDLLGSQVFGRFGPRLPFLLKILAISKPLSVQVHPTAEQAKTAFDGETCVPGEHRYIDPHPKPELLYALEPIDALWLSHGRGRRTVA
jgi:mannose-6-phosphate isomerase